jgi:hypothetical protein
MENFHEKIRQMFMLNSMEFHGKFRGIPWNSVEFHGIFHGIPWNSMEFHETEVDGI